MGQRDGDAGYPPKRACGIAVAIGMLLLLLLIVFPFIAPHFGSPHHSNMPSCLGHLKQIGAGVAMYRNDYDGLLPLPGEWRGAIHPYIKNDSILDCPLVKDEGKTGGYAYNAPLAGIAAKAVVSPDLVPLAFDSLPDRGLVAGGSRRIVMRHEHTANIVFVDTHTKAVKSVDDLKWDPK